MSLERLRQVGRKHMVDYRPDGFTLRVSPGDDREAFNQLVRQAVDGAGDEFVALPQPDGHQGYDGVYIISLDGLGG